MGDSALHMACASNNVEIVEYLISIGSNVNLENNKAATPLALCVSSQPSETTSNETRYNIAKALINHGAYVNSIDIQQVSILHKAVEKFNTLIVKLLLDNGADVDATDKSGHTPLHYAVRSGIKSEPIINLLLEFGASPSVRFYQHLQFLF